VPQIAKFSTICGFFGLKHVCSDWLLVLEWSLFHKLLTVRIEGVKTLKINVHDEQGEKSWYFKGSITLIRKISN
jgi:hypothetical protein